MWTSPPNGRTLGRVRRLVLRISGRRSRWTVLGAVAVLLIGAVTAQATTGADALNRPPRFRPTPAQVKPFLGGFTLTAHGSGIIDSTMRAGVNALGYVEGSMSVTQYSEGQPATFLATLYEYHYLGGGKLETDLWTPDLGSDLLGHLFLTRTAHGDLTGTLETGQTKVAVTYKPIGSGSAQATISRGVVSSGGGASITSLGDSTEGAGVFNTAVVAAQSLDSDT